MQTTGLVGRRHTQEEKFAIAIFSAFVALCISLAVRIWVIEYRTWDIDGFLLPWIDTFRQQGLQALRQGVGNYNIPYLLYLALIAKLPVDNVVAIKALSILFDYLLAGAFAYLVYLLRAGVPQPARRCWAALAFGVACLLPLPLLNSALWGQCDSIYSFFCLLVLISLMKDRWLAAFCWFGVAMAVKLQAIFIFPFIIFAYFARRRYKVIAFAPVVPIILFLSTLPAVLMGRSVFTIFEIYASQTGYDSRIFINYPGLAALTIEADPSYYQVLFVAAALMVCFAMMMWIVYKRLRAGRRGLLLLSIWSVLACLLFLPSMHERYAYVAEVLLVAWFLACPSRQNFIMAAVVNFAGYCAYASYLFRAWPVPAPVLAIANLAAFGWFTHAVVRQLQADTDKAQLLPENYKAQKEAEKTAGRAEVAQPLQAGAPHVGGVLTNSAAPTGAAGMYHTSVQNAAVPPQPAAPQASLHRPTIVGPGGVPPAADGTGARGPGAQTQVAPVLPVRHTAGAAQQLVAPPAQRTAGAQGYYRAGTGSDTQANSIKPV